MCWAYTQTIYLYFVCVYIYIYIHTYVYVYIYIHTCMYIYIRVCMYIYVCIYVCIYIHTCMCICIYIYIHVYMYIYYKEREKSWFCIHSQTLYANNVLSHPFTSFLCICQQESSLFRQKTNSWNCLFKRHICSISFYLIFIGKPYFFSGAVYTPGGLN